MANQRFHHSHFRPRHFHFQIRRPCAKKQADSPLGAEEGVKSRLHHLIQAHECQKTEAARRRAVAEAAAKWVGEEEEQKTQAQQEWERTPLANEVQKVARDKAASMVREEVARRDEAELTARKLRSRTPPQGWAARQA